MITAVSSAQTDPGALRSSNEDNLVDRPDLGLWAVADGAGGHGGGALASTAVVAALESIPPELSAAEMLAQVRLRLTGAHAELQGLGAAGHGKGGVIASTVVVLLLRGTHFAALWAGDSRAYLLRNGHLLRVTRDHSVVQEMLDAGLLEEADVERHPQGNVITRAVGGEGELQLDKVADRLQLGDCFLLCSDGLFRELAEPVIAGMLGRGADAAALVAASVAAGGRDNSTAVVVRL